MIGPHDRIELPDGVELQGEEIVDRVRGASLRLNSTGARLVGAMQQKSISEAAGELARDCDVRREQVEADAARLCAELNSRLLVNIRRQRGPISLVRRWTLLALMLVPLASLPSLPYRRYPELRGGKLTRSVGVLCALAGRSFALGCALGGLLVILLAASGLAAIALPLALLTGVAIAIAAPVHELAHVLALRSAPCFLISKGLRMAVVHNAGRDPLVAAAGPASGIVLALPALALVPALPEAAFLSIIFAGQLLGLTVLGKDGRNACGLPHGLI